MVGDARQLASHSGLVSDALEVAARHREVELEAQKVWVDDQLRKLKKGILETVSHEASERERNVLALWKEVRVHQPAPHIPRGSLQQLMSLGSLFPLRLG